LLVNSNADHAPPTTNTWKVQNSNYLEVEVNHPFYFYDWDNDLVDANSIKTT
jgi:hypothetical protein